MSVRMKETNDGECTPRHHPTYGVELTDETISHIVQHCLPHIKTAWTISRLPRGMSFNNKIYKIEPQEDGTVTNQSYILKVNGRFFGAAKVENEVSCLMLLRHFCPDIPVPRVVAWSADGADLTRCVPHGVTTTNIHDTALKKETTLGWILMTLLPGSRMDDCGLSTEAKSKLALQLAMMLSSWRQKIPKSLTCANLHFQPNSAAKANSTLYRPSAAIGPQLHVYGFLEYGNDFNPPVDSLSDYWKTELEWHYNNLSTKPAYSGNREALLPLLRKFFNETLLHLPLLQRGHFLEFVFTHTDLFPRNILVEGDPPKISAILDFEFSGFFPSMHEFTQEWLPNDDDSDWPSDMYEMMLEELERGGETTPRSISLMAWKETKNLNALRNYVAPWWLEELDPFDEKNLRQLREARQAVEEAVMELTRIVHA